MKIMPFCPSCGAEVGNARFCPSCGAEQGSTGFSQQGGQQRYPPQQTVRVTSGHQYDSGICVILCCCLSPVAALIYYLLTDHPDQQNYR